MPDSQSYKSGYADGGNPDRAVYADGTGDLVAEPMDEWRLTYNIGDGFEREHIGVVSEAQAQEFAARRSRNGSITDVRLWKRPTPEHWTQVEILEHSNAALSPVESDDQAGGDNA
jgi:hypothetical protein